MNIEYMSRYCVKDCTDNPDKLFIFGDNLAGTGTGGQAIIRYQNNAFGIPTKRFPTMHEGAFFHDKDCERNHVLNALRDLYTQGKMRTLVFPADGLGTGLAKMKEKSPLIYRDMCDILQTHFKTRSWH
jgi:hypothetical protein